MKNGAAFILATVIVSVSGMVGIHWWQERQTQAKVLRIEMATERQAIATRLALDLEKYRRQSANFRKMGEGEISGAKVKLRSGLSQGIESLGKLLPSPEEKALGEKVLDQLGEFLIISAKLEPQLFLRDVYQKPQPRELHDSMLGLLAELENSAKGRATSIREELAKNSSVTVRWLAGGAFGVIALVLLLMLRTFWAFSRPIRTLSARAEQLRAGQFVNEGEDKKSRPRLPSAFAGIESVMNELAYTVEKQRRERHQFIASVCNDLRSPLLSLEAGAAALLSDNRFAAEDAAAERTEAIRKIQAQELLRRSSQQLSRSLDDLTEMADSEKSEILRLDEKIVDLRELVTDVVNQMGAPGASHRLAASVPPMPVWTLLDPRRFERAIVNLVTKMSQYLPQGGRIELSLARCTTGSFRGLELVIQDGESHQAHQSGGERRSPPMPGFAPAQDLLRHWVAENGFGMVVVQRIIQAHGGSVSVSGVAGAGIEFRVKIPQKRVAGGHFMNPTVAVPSPSSADAVGGRETPLELTRVQPVLTEQAINFGA